MRLKLYHLSQDINTEVLVYRACIVVAIDKRSARLIHPDPRITFFATHDQWSSPIIAHAKAGAMVGSAMWAKPSQLTVKYLGRAAPDLITGQVLMAIFNRPKGKRGEIQG